MTQTPPTEAVERALRFQKRVAGISTEECPECHGPTTKGMVAVLGHCSSCQLSVFSERA